jgi:hypothetical protein
MTWYGNGWHDRTPGLDRTLTGKENDMGTIFYAVWLTVAARLLAVDAPDAVAPVIERVDRECREQGIPMIGPAKA